MSEEKIDPTEAPVKRKRGRPKGSKTKNRKVKPAKEVAVTEETQSNPSSIVVPKEAVDIKEDVIVEGE